MLKVGTYKVNITPPIGTPIGGIRIRIGHDGLITYQGFPDKWPTTKITSIGVHDDLLARALVVDNGDRQVAMVAADLLAINKENVERIRRTVEAATGIPGRNVMVSVSHTHCSPDTFLIERLDKSYVWYLESAIAGCVYGAWKTKHDASFGASKGELKGVTTNRRNSSGPVDPEVGVLSFGTPDGQLLACLVNYSTHHFGMRWNFHFSSVFPGEMSRIIESLKGGNAMFTDGAGANVGPSTSVAPKYVEDDPREENQARGWDGERRLGTGLAAESIKVLEQIHPTDNVEIQLRSELVELPTRDLPSLAEASRNEKLAEDALRMRGEKRIPLEELKKPFEKLADERGGGFYFDMAKEEYDLAFAREVLDLVRREEKVLRLEINCIRLGETLLVTAPVEMFAETGLAIKKASQYANTFILGYSNDYLGYMPTRGAFENKDLAENANLSNYESRPARSSRFTPAAEEQVKTRIIDMLSRMG